MASEPKISEYRHPAAGWGALKQVALSVFKDKLSDKGARLLLKQNQPDGFDCPGCAWPDREHTSTFEFCENGVKAVSAEATAKRATPDLFAGLTVAELMQQSDFELEDHGRLTDPLVYDAISDKYQPISWADAFALIASHLQRLPDPNQAAFYTSGRASNEAAFLFQLFVREYGTNNFPDCSNMCHEPTSVGLPETVGVGKGTVLLDDFDHCDTILCFGQNPATNHPRMLGELRECSKRGARIVSINPLRERGLERFASPQHPTDMLRSGVPISSEFIHPKLGGDFSLLKGVIKRLLEWDDDAQRNGAERIIDVEFIEQHTAHFDAFAAEIRAESWDALVADAGVAIADIDKLAHIYASGRAVIATWGMGLTQHKHAVATIQMLSNLMLLRGNIGRPGAGLCPVRGHSNVQGDRTVGIDEKPTAAFLDRLGQVFDFTPPREHGYDVVGTLQAMLAGKVKVLIALGGNFVMATPDTQRTFDAMRMCDLTVHITTKLNRSHLVHGRDALILPTLGRTEIDMQASGPQGVTVEDSMSMVHISYGINKPASPNCLSETAIVANLAAATLAQNSKTRWLWYVDDYARIRDAIEQVYDQFKNYNERIRKPGGFHLGVASRDRVWNTPSGRAEFKVHPIPHNAARLHAEQKYGARAMTLMTTRSHDQYNTTIYGMDDRYRGVYGQRRVVFANRSDLQRLGFEAGEWVDIISVWSDDSERRAERFLLVEYDIPAGCLGSYYPETNALVPLESFADHARTPTSKSIPVVLERCHG